MKIKNCLNQISHTEITPIKKNKVDENDISCLAEAETMSVDIAMPTNSLFPQAKALTNSSE